MRPAALPLLIPLLITLGAAQPDLARRDLTRLTPDEPERYLTLGEDLLDDHATAALARQTLALCVLIAADDDPALAASAAIALASAEPGQDARDGLWALAVELDPARAEDRRWLGVAHAADDLGVRAALLLGGLRSGVPEAASTLASDAAVRSRVLAEGVRLGHDRTRIQAILEAWERNARNDPCRGQMFVRVRNGAAMRPGPCPSPDHHHGVRLDDAWRTMVGIELALLNASPASWAAQAAVHVDAAVPVWDLDRLARAYAVSADRPYRRHGEWTAR